MPVSQIERIRQLHTYDILDSEEEQDFNDLTELACLICNCPISMITFIDADRQWFKARKNYPEKETPIDLSFCVHTVDQDRILVIEDATEHALFANYANVSGVPNIRFYAGCPVRVSSGASIGTICVIDTKPKKLADDQLDALQKISRQVSNLLELRLMNRRLKKRSDKLLQSAETYKDFFDNAPYPKLICDMTDNRFLAVNKAAQKLYGYTEEEFNSRSLLDIVIFDEEELKRLNQLTQKGEIVNFITNHKKKDGSLVVVDVNISTIMLDGHWVTIRTIIDLSEKLHLQQSLMTEKKQTKERIEKATLDAQSQERKFLGRELHDNINQMLASTKLYLDIAYSNDEMRLDLINRSKKNLLTAIDEVRALSHKLVDSTSKGLNLNDAINELLTPFDLNSSFEIEYIAEGSLIGLPVDVKISLLRILQESIQNVSKYAGASKVLIHLSVADNVKLLVQDNGKGFDTTKKTNGIGIRNIHERAHIVKGKVQIQSAIGKGCSISVTIPLNENEI